MKAVWLARRKAMVWRQWERVLVFGCRNLSAGNLSFKFWLVFTLAEQIFRIVRKLGRFLFHSRFANHVLWHCFPSEWNSCLVSPRFEEPIFRTVWKFVWFLFSFTTLQSCCWILLITVCEAGCVTLFPGWMEFMIPFYLSSCSQFFGRSERLFDSSFHSRHFSRVGGCLNFTSTVLEARCVMLFSG